MQKVSQEWKDIQNDTIVDESFVEVVLALTDPDASEDVSSTDNGNIYISNTEQVTSEVDKDIIPYTTLEQNLWVLDGNLKTIPKQVDNFGDCGYIANVLSNSSGVFTTEPTLIMDFSQVHSMLISGVTITWGTAYDDYATDFTVTAYNGDTIVSTKKVTNNTDMKSVVYVDIVNYDRITISVSKWCLPHRRARIAEVLVGVEKTYSKKELFSFSHTQEVDPISATLPKSEISLSIDNTDNSYDPNNLDNLSKYLIERQEIKARYGFKVNDKIEWIKCGTFYMSEWDAPQNGLTATFKARDLLEFMTDKYYRGKYVPTGVSLYDLAVDVLETANLPLNDDGSVKWVIDESLKDIYTVAPLPIDTYANCLQLIANAGQCVIYQDRKGVLHIEKIPLVYNESEPTDYGITYFNSYSKSDIALSKPLKQVDVLCYNYTASDEQSELFNNSLTINGTEELWITYPSPADNVVIYVGGAVTLEAHDIFTNACLIRVTGKGEVDIEITGHILNSSSVTVTTPSGITGETITVDNPLISNHNHAIAIGSRIEGYMKNRMNLKSSWRADPRLDALDIVDNENDFNINKVLMTSVSYEYNGAFKGSGEGRVI